MTSTTTERPSAQTEPAQSFSAAEAFFLVGWLRAHDPNAFALALDSLREYQRTTPGVIPTVADGATQAVSS